MLHRNERPAVLFMVFMFDSCVRRGKPGITPYYSIAPAPTRAGNLLITSSIMCKFDFMPSKQLAEDSPFDGRLIAKAAHRA